MKIKEDSSSAVQVTQSDRMDSKSFARYSKTTELIDECLDALRKEDEGSQGSSHQSNLGTQCKHTAARSLASTMGEFDIDVMQPFYTQCERGLGVSAPQSMTVGDSSGDDTFAAEMLSPMSTPSFAMLDVTSPVRWSSNSGKVSGTEPARGCHTMGTVSDTRAFNVRGHSDPARCNRVGKRFLSSETISPISDCQNAGKRITPTSARQVAGNFVAGGTPPEGRDYDSIKCIADNASALQGSQKGAASLLGVMREIDIAVSMAHSRFEDIGGRAGKNLLFSMNQGHVASDYSSCELDTQPGLHTTIGQPSRLADACPPMTKDYASHNMRARSTEDEWKRKSDYGGAAPAAQELSFEQSRCSDTLGHHSAVTYSDPGSERNCGTVEVAPRESEFSEQSQLAFETKINSNHDEKNYATYAVGASLLHVQSPTHESHWPQRRAYEKQVIAKSSGRSGTGGAHTEVLLTSELENKPINLCLQQGKRRDSELGLDVSTLKSTNPPPEFRKCARSFSSRDKPYQFPKRRTRSQCLVSPALPSAVTRFGAGFADAKPESTRQATIRDMGIDNRTVLENYTKDSGSFLGGKGSLADSNSINLFSASEASHMMVQDEAKTYAILSGRCNEDLMNPHVLSASGSPHQHHSLYQQARHSHSIINYVGPHGRSPDMRHTEMSPSPPIRDHRATPSSSLPGILPSGKGYPNVIVAPRQHQHSASPSQRDDFHGHNMFQRQYDNTNTPFDAGLQDSRRHLHQHHSLALGHHPTTSTFSPLHISPPQYHHHHHQQPSQYLVKHHQKREYFDSLPSHSGLGTSSSMTPYAATLQVNQHQGYLKPPPVDLDDLSDEERQRMTVKRERNRVAAAKCRNRRRELLERLEKEAEQLEREQELLRENVRRLRVQKLQLGNMLEEHEPTCQKNITDEGSSKPSGDQEAKDDDINGAPTGGLISNGGESSTNTTTSPVQLPTQA